MTVLSQQSSKGEKKAKKHKLSLRPGFVDNFETQLADERGSCVLSGGRYERWQRSFRNDIQL